MSSTPIAAGATESPPRLLRTRDGAALVVANVIGVGIFTTPGIVARLVPDAAAFLALWLVGGAVALAGARAYAELAARLPRAGGEYLYLARAFGPLPGFLSGWTSFVAGFSGAIAAAAVGFAFYLGRLLPAVGDAEPLVVLALGPLAARVSPRTLTAVALIALVAVVHVLGVRPGRRVQLLLAGGCLLAIAVFVAGGFLAPAASVERLASHRGPVAPSAWLLALVPVLFTYSGWNAAVYVAEEMRDAARSVDRALFAGTGAVIAAYLSLVLLFLAALPPAELAGEVAVGDAAARVLFGRLGGALLVPAILLALASSVSAMMMAGPRVYWAMARDGVFPRAAGRLDRRRGTPRVAILAQAGWSALLVVTGTFEALLIYTGFAVVLFSGLAVLSLFVLRRRQPPAPLSAGRLAPAAFVAIAAAVLANALWTRPGPTAAGAAVIAAGLPLYAWLRRRR
ncbi:MAG: APC family permease [Acidobacteria bacterium]|nr:MAG: APC family permease [Acidobacteriota bacterium]